MLWTFSVHTAIYIKKGSIINVVCYERVCYERVCYEHGLLWKWSVFNRSVVNVVCFEWSVMNGLLWTGLFWMGTLTHTMVCKITSQELRMRIKSTQENLSSIPKDVISSSKLFCKMSIMQRLVLQTLETIAGSILPCRLFSAFCLDQAVVKW